MLGYRRRVLKNKIIEFIKYDANGWKWPLTGLGFLLVSALRWGRQDLKAFSVAARLYRLGWAGTYRLGLSTLKYFLERDKLRGKALFINFASRVKPLKNTKKYFDDPRQMLGGIIIILKVPSGNERGVLLLKYSYYFLLFLEFYDVARIQERYNIILEPSWAGFCDETIMAYTQLPEPVFVQVYERRDRRLIDALDVNLIPLDVGPSWFVDHEVFSPPLPSEKRDIDIIMVASWSTFKRHDAVFEVLSVLRERKPDLSIALVGYPGDLTKDDIAQMASRRGLTMGLSFYEWITPSEVAQLLKRARVNVLWSKFEGNNRAIIEGMFCDTPCVLRRGHNYGEHYDYINEKTGFFCDESDLAEKIAYIFEHPEAFSPRSYVMTARNCEIATERMSSVIRAHEQAAGRPWCSDLLIKVNELHGMRYWHAQEPDNVQAACRGLAQHIKPHWQKEASVC